MIRLKVVLPDQSQLADSSRHRLNTRAQIDQPPLPPPSSSSNTRHLHRQNKRAYSQQPEYKKYNTKSNTAMIAPYFAILPTPKDLLGMLLPHANSLLPLQNSLQCATRACRTGLEMGCICLHVQAQEPGRLSRHELGSGNTLRDPKHRVLQPTFHSLVLDDLDNMTQSTAVGYRD